MISNLTIGDLTIDCVNTKRARDFYADLMGWEKTTAFGALAVKTDNGMTILFWEPDIPYVPPVWPEEDRRQQKQMHLDFSVDDMPSALETAIRHGASQAASQYGGEHFVTLLDPEGHPFCLCKRQNKSEFNIWFEKRGFSAIPNPSINIDCPDTASLREFYAELTGWAKDFHKTSLVAENGVVIHFMQCDFDYIPPVWPEEAGNQQKQMHLNFQVDDLPAAVEYAIRLGASKTAAQYGGKHFYTLTDPVGHPFCLCEKSSNDI